MPQLRVCLLSLCILISAGSPAQQAVVFTAAPAPDMAMDIAGKTLFYQEPSASPMPFAAVRKQPFGPIPPALMQFAVPEKSLIVNWLKFSICNAQPADTLRLMLACNPHSSIQLYANEQLIQQGGVYPGGNDLQRFGLMLWVPPGNTTTYWVRLEDKIRYIMPIVVWIQSPERYLADTLADQERTQYLFLFLSMAGGCLLFIAIYALYQYIAEHELTFLYYSGYALSASLTALIFISQRFGMPLPFPYFDDRFNIPIISILVIFYSLFLASIFKVKAYSLRSWRVLQFFLALVLLETSLEVYENISGQYLFASNNYYLHIQPLPSVFCHLYLLYLCIRIPSPVKSFLLAGICSLALFFFLPFMFNFWVPNLPPKLEAFINYAPSFLLLGLSTEAICFAFALGYRSKLLQQAHQQLQQKIADTEMTALRAQMNPHFIFNCLNSIKLYTLENHAELAAHYLGKFSRLIRLVLENSIADKISLDEELETLQLYLDMEIMRFKDKINYHIHVANNVETSYTEIPPLLLQPYVENAIWHGLMHQEKGGTIRIDIHMPSDDLLRVVITDNGVGRQKAAELNSKSAIRHKSFGMKITADRMQLINQKQPARSRVAITDLHDGHGHAVGTEVIIDIPL